MKAFEDPPALDLLIEFKKRCISPGGDRYVTIDREEISRYLDRELSQVIRAFVLEAVQPWQQAFTDAAMRTAGPLVMPGMERETPREYVELWRGQHLGRWYRLMLRDYYRLELQVNTGMPEHECWSVEWSR